MSDGHQKKQHGVGDLLITQVCDPQWVANTYLVRKSGKAIIIDAGSGPEQFKEELQETESIFGVFLTHAHRDHTAHLSAWTNRGDLTVYCHQDIVNEVPGEVRAVQDEEIIDADGIAIRSLLTPGHCKGHLAFEIDGAALFSGDLLFKNSVGGCVGPTGDFEQLKSSLLSLPDKVTSPDVQVFPGHTEETVLEDELESNPFYQFWNEKSSFSEEECSVRGERAKLLVLATDYDGGKKALVEFVEGDSAQTQSVVPGSWIT